MMRIPLPLWLLSVCVVAFSFFLYWHIEHKGFILALISTAGFTLCLAELVQRLVEHFRNRRRP
ncbi:hypothetical protein [Pectobacterium polaris]|uniref:hypothetical protein n=1 Tax=Pectobacterium polaris TaxID=2042057 RepID=UPI0021CACAAB|nr:hypothetical protein [Pectobacterium polaris]MCU1794178.1 hypothetical protein [Pectobacterium polaris]